MIERIDESKKLSLREIQILKTRMNLLRRISFWPLIVACAYILLIIFSPVKNIIGSWLFRLFLVSFVGWYSSHAFKFVKAWEDAVLFLFGKKITVFKSGLHFVLYPFFKVIFVLTWEREIDIPEQLVHTKDGLATVDIRLYFVVDKSDNFLIAVEDPVGFAARKAKGDVTTASGPMTYDQLLVERDKLAETIKKSLAGDVKNWGMKITQVRLDNIKISEDVLKARENLAKAQKEADIVRVNADAQLYKVQREAEAEKAKLVAEAQGRAEEFRLKVLALGPEGAKIMGAILTAAEWGKGEGKFFIDPATVGIPAIAEILKSIGGEKK